MSSNYKFHNKQGAYFISFATVYWLAIFTRQIYFNILEDSIQFCRKEKGMEVFAYCFMPNHVHLLFRSSNENPSRLIRARSAKSPDFFGKTNHNHPQNSYPLRRL